MAAVFAATPGLEAQTSGIFRELYTGISGGSIASLTNSALFPGNWSSTNILSTFETTRNTADNYGQRLRGLVVPPTTGDYAFWIASDDQSVMFLSPDESPANKVRVAWVNSATSTRQWTKETNQYSGSIRLEGGQRYYLEVLHKEGTGSDHLAVQWRLPQGTVEEPMPGSRLRPYGLPASSAPQIVQQPTNVTILEGGAAVFRVGLSTLDEADFQWQRQGTNVPGARGASLRIGAATLADHNTTYRCVVSNRLGTTLSALATLSVLADTNAPVPLIAANQGTSAVVVVFSEPVDPASATNTANYALSGGVTVTRATMGATAGTVVLNTTPLTPGAMYSLGMVGVRDRAAAANAVAPNSQISFRALVRGIYLESYTNIAGNLVSDLTEAPGFPGSPSSAQLLGETFEVPGNSGDSFGRRFRAMFEAPLAGPYVFGVTADESAELWLATNGVPDAAQRVAWCSAAMLPRQWDGQTNQKSASVTLAKGQTCYVELLVKESIGNDHVSVRWQLPTGLIEEPVPALRFTPYGMSPPLITSSPASVVAEEGGQVTLEVVTANRDPLYYQWQRNGTNVPGATNATLRLAGLRLDDNGSQFRCQAANALGAAWTTEATLTVTPDVTPPRVVGVMNDGPTEVVIYFSERVALPEATNAAAYLLDGGVTVSAASLGPDGLSARLTTSPLIMGNRYTLSVSGIYDTAATPNEMFNQVPLTFIAHEFFPQPIGEVARPSGFEPAAGGMDVVAAGRDIGGSGDEFNLSYQRRTGDFDVRVRVQTLEFADTLSQAGLMARESLATNSRFAAVLATPSVAGAYFQYRTNTGAAAVVAGGFPVNYPETWLRLKRAGAWFSGYGSLDGQNWTPMGTVSNALPATVYLGLAVASRSSREPVRAAFRDFGEVAAGVLGPPPQDWEPPGPSSRRTGWAITEILYHPADRDDGRRLEFVELYNSNPWPEELDGCRLSGDIAFDFPEGMVVPGGGYVVVARDPEDVRTVYGITNVVGPYAGNLPNDQGRVRLRGRAEELLLEVNYGSRPPWPVAPDGTGHSLVLRRPSLGENEPEAWAASGLIGGSPGRAEGWRAEASANVFLNEIMAGFPGSTTAYVELYNHSREPVNLSGYWLSDEPGVVKYRLPEGTVLGPTGLVWFAATELGFAPNPLGGRLFLVSSNQDRVVDCLFFEGQESGVAWGRHPDGAAGPQRLLAPTPGQPNAVPRPSEVVIHEIMYHPISERDDEEFVELYNPGAMAVSLDGWRFSDGIDFVFPTGAVVAAGGYVVVARDKSRLLATHPALSPEVTFGNFEGALSNEGERLALSKPALVLSTNQAGEMVSNWCAVVVDEVRYGTGGRWGQWSDGGGSSLELTDPRSDNRLPGAWADSDESGKSPWSLVTATGNLDHSQGSNWNSLQIYLQDAGEALVDEVSVTVNGSSNLVINGGFEGGLSNWVAQGNQGRSSLAPTGYNSAHALHLRASGRGDTGANRVRTTLSSSYSNNVTGTITAMARWLCGSPEILFRLRGNHLEAPGVLTVPSNLGTPGGPNSRRAANAGPAIAGVRHAPVLPASGQAVVVRAHLSDPDGLSAARLVYRVDPAGPPITVDLRDDGTDGDRVPGDGEYAATIPGQTNDALVAFYLEASDNAATRVTRRYPEAAPARECLVHFGDVQPAESFGTYRFWLTQSNFSRWVNREKLSNEPIEGSFVYGNWRAIYEAGNRYAGSPYHSPSFNSPTGNNCDYTVTLPPDDNLMGSREFTLQRPGNGGNDSMCQTEQTAYWIAGQLGAPFLHRRPVNVFINGVRRGIIYEDTQQPNRDFGRQWFPDYPEGDLYKVMVWFEFEDAASAFTSAGASLNPFLTTGGAKKLARYRQNFGKRAVRDSASNYTNLFGLVDTLNSASNGAAYVSRLFEEVDVREWARAFATERIVGNTDLYGNGGGQNCYLYKPDGRGWQFLIWDIDFAFNSQPPTYTLFNFSDAPIIAMFSNPPVRRIYWQTLEDAAWGPLEPGRILPRIDARYAAYRAAGINAAAPDNLKNFITQRRDYILAVLQGGRAPLIITNMGGRDFTNTSTLVTLGGTAPIGARVLTINGVPWPVTWHSITNWTALVPLSGRETRFEVSGVDAGGQSLGTRVIQVYFDGVVDRAEDSLRISEIMWNPLAEGGEYVELQNRSTTTTFSLAGHRLRGLDFTFPDGLLMGPRSCLVVVRNRQVFESLYGSTAWIAGEYPGRLDPDGESLALVRVEPSGAETVLNRMRFETRPPWPEGAATPGSGRSLQVVNPALDNARVSNWADGTEWRYFSLTGPPQLSRLYIFMDTAGEVYVDDLSIVPGTVAGVGTNLVVNGDFEAPLEGSFLITSNKPYAIYSTAGAGPARTGSGCLHLVFTNAGNTTAYLYQDLTNIVGTNLHTLSFWYRSGSNSGNLTVRMGSYFRATVDARPTAPTPGLTNPVPRQLLPYPPLWLNEVRPSGSESSNEDESTASGWVELFNSGTNALSLEGMFLSDSYTNLQQWAFPTGAFLPAGGFLVLQADGRPELSSGQALHTSFRLRPRTGSVALSLGNQLLDYINYSDVPSGHAYGSWPDGQGLDRRLFYHPTPGASNNPAPLPVVINEWMASNTRSLTNPATGRCDDWIELYNAGDQPVDLSGYYLTDNPGNWNRWRLPEGTSISSQGFLLVWADGDDSSTNTMGNALHAPFQLDRSGESLGLFAADGTPVDTVTFGAQTADASQGRYPDGNVAGGLHSMLNPTPMGANRIGDNRYVPVLDPAPDAAIEEGALWRFQAYASDLDTPPQPLFFFLGPGAPFGAAIGPETGLLEWTPAESQGGQIHRIAIGVSDQGNPPLMATQVFLVTVRKVNSAPWIEPVPDVEVYPGMNVNVRCRGRDGDLPPDSLTFSLGQAPPGSTLDAQTGEFRWLALPSPVYPATNVVAVIVTDSGNPPLSGTTEWRMVVHAPPGLAVQLTDGGRLTRLSWESPPGLNWRVQYTDSLSPADWKDLENTRPEEKGRVAVEDPTAGVRQRFYRLVAQP